MYGCWLLALHTKDEISEKIILSPCSDNTIENAALRADSSLLPLSKSIFKVMDASKLNCTGDVSKKINGNWSFDSASGIVNIYYLNDHKAEFWKKTKELYPDLEIPKPLLHQKN